MATPPSGSLFVSLVSAVLLYLFAGAFGLFASFVVPHLVELMEKSVRLGALGWLALLASPIAFIGLAHRWTHGLMDRFDPDKSNASRSIDSARAGMFGWFAMSFSSLASGLLLLALFPPPPDESGLAALVRLTTDMRLEMGVHAALWIGVAALLFRVDGAARG